jgi:phosphoribosylamine--glycine ligase
MRILVVGKGGREHALAWKLALSNRADKVFVAPGNAGTDGGPGGKLVSIKVEQDNFEGLVQFAKSEKVGLVVIGPEEPLAKGITDVLEKEGLKVFGPSRAASQLEASKVYCKELMRQAGVPTADFKVCDHPQIARTYIDSRDYDLVVKADGLAAGKGVIVCSGRDEAYRAIDRIMVREEFGAAAGRHVVVEKRLTGREVSILALVSGRCILPLDPGQDHKALQDYDKGPNTGGMGVYTPAAWLNPELAHQIDEEVFVPTIHAMRRLGSPYKGCLFAGLMITPQGPRVLEFNCRFGDPETQPLLMRLKTDLLDLMQAVVDGTLEQFEGKIEWDQRHAVCVVAAAAGYPANPRKGDQISGLDEVARMPDVQVFHAGTRRDGNRVLTDGGRVLGVTALGNTLSTARENAYAAIRKIQFRGMQFRSDIGLRDR